MAATCDNADVDDKLLNDDADSITGTMSWCSSNSSHSGNTLYGLVFTDDF